MPVGILLFLLFIIIPITEIFLLIRLSQIIGFGSVLMIAVVTAFLGSYLMKNQGKGVVGVLKESLRCGESPARALVDGLCIVVSGVLLITPGLISDTIGLALLLPLVRNVIVSLLQKLSSKKSSNFQFHSSFSQGKRETEGYIEEEGIIDTSGERLD